MAVIGELATLITARTESFRSGLKEAGMAANTFSGSIKNKLGSALGGLTGSLGKATGGITAFAGTITSKLGSALSGITGMLSGTAGGLLALGGGLGITALIAKSIKLATAAEDMEVAYTTYLKSAEKARDVLAELDRFSGNSPFQVPDVKEAGKQLLAFGFEAENLMRIFYVLGDVSAGTMKPMADFVDIIGKVRASGVASMGDVNRLADRGVPIFQELANVMGVATSEVRDLVGQSKVGFEQLWQALENTMGPGGIFKGAMAALAKTTTGTMSSLEDEINLLLTFVGKGILQGLDIKGTAKSLTELIQLYKQDIIDATAEGVRAIADIMKGLTVSWMKIERLYEGVAAGYHWTMDKYWSAVDWVGSLPGASAPEARRYALEHRSAYLESQIAGMDISRELYRMSPGAPTTHRKRAASAQPEGPQRMDDIWKLQDAMGLRQEMVFRQQLAEDRAVTRQMVDENAQWREQTMKLFWGEVYRTGALAGFTAPEAQRLALEHLTQTYADQLARSSLDPPSQGTAKASQEGGDAAGGANVTGMPRSVVDVWAEQQARAQQQEMLFRANLAEQQRISGLLVQQQAQWREQTMRDYWQGSQSGGRMPGSADAIGQGLMQNQEAMAEVWARQDADARRQEQLYEQHVAEQQKTNQLLREQNQLWRQWGAQQTVVVDHF